MIGTCAFASALLLLFPAGDDAPEMAEELALHRGTWAVERSVRDGEEGPPEVMTEIVRVVEGDRVVWKRAGRPFAATRFELDLSSDPKRIDLIPEGGRNRGGRVLGIYRFEGDRLLICTADPGRPRPTAFEAGPGDGATLMIFRRVEAGADDPQPRADPPREAP